MSSKTTTATNNQYNQAGMNNYNSFAGQLGSVLPQMVGNPLGNSFFNQQLAQAQGSAQQMGQRNISNILANQRTGGGLLGNGGAFTQASLNNAMLSNSANQSGAFNSALGSALNNRNYALQAMQGYNPLQTGANTTQTKSGLGTWLPQLAGAALGAATGMGGLGALGGLMGGAGGAFGAIADGNSQIQGMSTQNPELTMGV